jgi:hypothetical protein
MALDGSKMMIVNERTRCRELTLPARTRCREHELRGHAHELGVFEAHRADELKHLPEDFGLFNIYELGSWNNELSYLPASIGLDSASSPTCSCPSSAATTSRSSRGDWQLKGRRL